MSVSFINFIQLILVFYLCNFKKLNKQFKLIGDSNHNPVSDVSLFKNVYYRNGINIDFISYNKVIKISPKKPAVKHHTKVSNKSLMLTNLRIK